VLVSLNTSSGVRAWLPFCGYSFQTPSTTFSQTQNQPI